MLDPAFNQVGLPDDVPGLAAGAPTLGDVDGVRTCLIAQVVEPRPVLLRRREQRLCAAAERIAQHGTVVRVPDEIPDDSADNAADDAADAHASSLNR